MTKNFAIRYAAENGHLGVVKFLFEKGASLFAADNWALKYASTNGHLNIVKFIIEKDAIFKANNNHLDADSFLIADYTDLSKDPYNCAIKYAAEYGHLEIVK